MNKSLSISSCHHAQTIRNFFKKTRIVKTEPPISYSNKKPKHDESEQNE
ncbi:hypothetical protein SAMN05660830_01593 [Halodesulfovibrio aestuarii]|uniref:Uncharacterized protein n=1 Tax=Halodesulfovibrio aestuarii TaxID=126333 RepID=A0A8G2C9E8_9BACT|nr:hypothetical protein SAMN05660830_01593 [Halodesulfovibrio aestuarii]